MRMFYSTEIVNERKIRFRWSLYFFQCEITRFSGNFFEKRKIWSFQFGKIKIIFFLKNGKIFDEFLFCVTIVGYVSQL